jgi:hypothetical protein
MHLKKKPKFVFNEDGTIKNIPSKTPLSPIGTSGKQGQGSPKSNGGRSAEATGGEPSQKLKSMYSYRSLRSGMSAKTT